MPDQGRERLDRVTRALHEDGLDAFVCSLPSNVLLLSGYWPVIGNAIAIARADGSVCVVAPEDERMFVERGWASEVRTFEAGSLDKLLDTCQAVAPVLSELRQALGFDRAAKVGIEAGCSVQPASYAAAFTYGAALSPLLHEAFPEITLVDASNRLAILRSVLVTPEITSLRRACEIAERAFTVAAHSLAPGVRECQVAAKLRAHLSDGDRCDGFAYCMSGPNSARAYAAFQHSTSRALALGDFVLLHCNSYCRGIWTDITRTFVLGQPDSRQAAIRDAVLEASMQARQAVRPGVRVCEVDRAARSALSRAGFGREFKHATGHGVGFAAIDHNARPRIHPASNEVLEEGMVFNIEPAVYIEAVGGFRDCDLVLVTHDGAELLTPFQTSTASRMA